MEAEFHARGVGRGTSIESQPGNGTHPNPARSRTDARCLVDRAPRIEYPPHMTTPWLSLQGAGGERRVPLDRPVLRLGGPGCDVTVPDVGTGQLHVWSTPPKAVRVGGGPELFVGGKRVEEAHLTPGAVAVWGPVQVSVGGMQAVLEELAEEAPARPAAARGRSAGPEPGPNARRVQQRLLAGLYVELGLAPKEAVKRWQGSVVQGEWDADGCARDVLDGADAGLAEDPRVLERAGRLQRDLVMASFQKGLRKAVRSARGAARQGSAFLIANVLAFVCFMLIIGAIAILLRVRWNVSFDERIDRLMSLFG